MIQINQNPSRRDLLIFGLLLPLFLGVLVGLALFRWDSPVLAQVVGACGLPLVLVFWAIPPSRRLIYIGWMYAVFPIGWTISHTILLLIYVTVFTPIGLILRLAGHDPMARRFHSKSRSYWEAYQPEGDPKRYFRQF